MKKRIHFPVKDHFIYSLIHSGISWKKAISELIDNSIDAGAHNIKIDFLPETCRIADDGAGCDDLEKMLSIGRHSHHITTALGRYGVGLKDAAAGLAKQLFISTCRNGMKRESIIDWEWISNHGLESDEESFAGKFDNGTLIELRNLTKRMPTGKFADEIRDTFEPALRHGIRISLDGEQLMCPVEPQFCESDFVDYQAWDNGVGFHAAGGILSGGITNKGRGPFILTYKHRVLASTSEPCMDFGSSERFLCTVELLDSDQNRWELLKNKDGISQSQNSEWLYSKLFSGYQQMLEKLDTAADEIFLNDLNSELALDLNLVDARERERRGQGDASGTVIAKDTGRERLQADITEGPGKCLNRNRSARQSGVRMKFAELNGKIGKVDVNGKRVEIILNTKFPIIQTSMDSKDRRSLMLIAKSLFAGHQSTYAQDHEQQLVLKQVVGESNYDIFLETFSKWCNHQTA